MRSDDDKRELQARQRELTNQLNRTTPGSGQIAGSGAATPPSRQREDSATSVRADEQQARPSRSSFPHAAAPAGTPSTTSEPSMSDEPETMTPDSSAAGSDTPGASRSATELSESAAVVAGSHVEPSRDSEHPPSDRPGKDGDTAAAVSSGSAQSPPPSGAPSSASADRADDTDSDSSYERHAESSPPSSTTDAQPAKRPASPNLSPRHRQTVIRRRRRPRSAAPTLHHSRSRARHRVLRSKQAKQCPRTRLPASVAAYLRLRPRPTQPTPGPLAQPTRASIGCTTTARPPRSPPTPRATQQHDIPQLR